MHSPRRIIFINRFFWPDESATSQILTDLARALGKDPKFAIEIITSNQLYTDAKKRLPALEQHAGVAIRRIWSTRFGRDHLVGRFVDYLTFYISLCLRMLVESRRADCIVAKTDPPLLSIPLTLIGALFGTPVISWCQDLFPEIAWARVPEARRPWVFRLLRAMRNASLAHCRACVVLGEDMRQHVDRETGGRARAVVIPNWADGDAIQPVDTAHNPLRAQWQLDDALVVGYSGNLGRVHEYHTMLGAATRTHCERLKFLFIGSGALQARLREEIPTEAATRFLFQPYQPREHLRLSLGVPDIHWLSLAPEFRDFVFPSKLYGILAAGRPCVFIGDIDSELARMIVANGIGAVFRPGDADGLRAFLEACAADPTPLAEMGRRARALFEQHGNLPHSVALWRDLLREVSAT